MNDQTPIDRMKVQQVNWHLRRVFVNFFREVAVMQPQNREYEITDDLFRAVNELVEIDSEHRFRVVVDLIADLIDTARDDENADIADDDWVGSARNQLINSAAKIHAERMSKTAVQLSRAESNFSDLIRHYDQARSDRRRYR